jgi:hypothetical protein
VIINSNKKTLYVNLISGPGAGKSTLAAGLYWYMKTQSYNNLIIELVREYAKDLVWLQSIELLKDQVHVTCEQYKRMLMLDGKVDIAITDSPLLIGLVYGQYPKEFINDVLKMDSQFHNINIFIKRNLPYESSGRIQTENEAHDKDLEIRKLYEGNNIPYIDLNETDNSLFTIMKLYGIIMKEYNRTIKEDN